jgi:hypothetical protein
MSVYYATYNPYNTYGTGTVHQSSVRLGYKNYVYNTVYYATYNPKGYYGRPSRYTARGYSRVAYANYYYKELYFAQYNPRRVYGQGIKRTYFRRSASGAPAYTYNIEVKDNDGVDLAETDFETGLGNFQIAGIAMVCLTGIAFVSKKFTKAKIADDSDEYSRIM